MPSSPRAVLGNVVGIVAVRPAQDAVNPPELSLVAGAIGITVVQPTENTLHDDDPWGGEDSSPPIFYIE